MLSEQMISFIDADNVAWNALNVDGTTAAISEESIDFGDMIANKHASTKPAVKAYMAELFHAFANPNRKVISKAGYSEFCATEWTFSFNYVNQTSLIPIPAQGQEIKMVGASLYWFDGDGKVVKMSHYGSFLAEQSH